MRQKMIKIYRNVYDGARNNCLFVVYFGANAVFFKRWWSRKKYGLFALHLFNPYTGKIILDTRRKENGKKKGKLHMIWQGNGPRIVNQWKK